MDTDQEAEVTAAELADLAKSRAYLVAFLNMHFNRLPDAQFVSDIRTKEYTDALALLMEEADLHPELSVGADLMRRYIEATASLTVEALSEQLGVDRTRLYRGVSPTYGPPPPYEGVWTRSGQQSATVLQKVMGTYREDGFDLAEDARERADYIGIELEYVRQMAEREAAAWGEDDKKGAYALLPREKAFVEGLNAWFPAFLDKAETYVETDFYRGHIKMLRGFLKEELERIEFVIEESGANLA